MAAFGHRPEDRQMLGSRWTYWEHIRPSSDHRLYLYVETCPPGRRQNTCPLDRSILACHTAAIGRQGSILRPEVRRDGSLGAGGLWRRVYSSGDSDDQVG